MNLLFTFIGLYAFTVLCWVLYLAVMSLARHRHELRPVAKIHAYMLLAVAYPLDIVLNVIVGTLVFISPPLELTLTGRLKRHQRDGGLRGKMAAWVCTHFLNTFDPDGHHC